MDDQTRRLNEQFEDEVRRIARELWPSAQHSGAAIVDGQERDGIFETEECYHLLEATTSRKKDKAQADIAKLIGLANKYQRRAPQKAVRCWFITRDEPTAEQREIIAKHRAILTGMSFSQFQSQLIDARAYLSARDRGYFGSVRDPETGAATPRIGYIETALSRTGSSAVASSQDLAAAMANGERIVVLGDFGAGKSMTLRRLYEVLRDAHLQNTTPRFPVFINLREHYGQSDPAEVLERHARSIGFSNPPHLVRAWRSGYVHLLLDGFDEVTTLNIQGLWTKLRDNRYRAMEAVRRLIRDQPIGAGLAISGRAHFFDSANERRNGGRAILS
jgi:hypothetical protein